MKINMQKFARVIPCVVSLVLVFSLMLTNVSATSQYVDPYKYIKSIDSSGSIEIINVVFDNIVPLHRIVTAGIDEIDTATRVEFTVTPGMSNVAIVTWQNGVQSADGQKAPDGAIRVADILAGSSMVLETSFGFDWEHGSSGAGGWFNIDYQGFVRCYDADGNFIKRIAGDRLSFSENLVGSGHLIEKYQFKFTLPENCAFICPSSNFTMWPKVTSEIAWSVMFEYISDPFGMTITRDSIATDSAMNQAIIDKLEQMYTGDPEDNNSAQNSSDKMNSAINGLGSVQNALDDIQQPVIDFESLLPDELIGATYLNVVAVIKEFWKIPLLSRMTTVLGVFILYSVVFFGKKV